MNGYSQEVGYPQRIEKVSSPDLLFTMVFTEIDEFKDIGMPGFEVYCKCSGPLIATLVDIARGGIKRTKHWHDAIRVAIGTCNVGTGGHHQHNMVE